MPRHQPNQLPIKLQTVLTGSHDCVCVPPRVNQSNPNTKTQQQPVCPSPDGPTTGSTPHSLQAGTSLSLCNPDSQVHSNTPRILDSPEPGPGTLKPQKPRPAARCARREGNPQLRTSDPRTAVPGSHTSQPTRKYTARILTPNCILPKLIPNTPKCSVTAV